MFSYQLQFMVLRADIVNTCVHVLVKTFSSVEYATLKPKSALLNCILLTFLEKEQVVVVLKSITWQLLPHLFLFE